MRSLRLLVVLMVLAVTEAVLLVLLQAPQSRHSTNPELGLMWREVEICG